MPESAAAEFVIQGITLDGKPFRPSDWAERLCGVMAAFGGDHRMQYSPFVHPITVDGMSPTQGWQSYWQEFDARRRSRSSWAARTLPPLVA